MHELLLIGIFFGFAPDLDVLYGFMMNHIMTISEDKFDHRKYLSHVPILWFIPAMLIFLFAPNPFWKSVGLLIWVGSWTHFILDSIENGVMWLWPLSTKNYSLIPGRVKCLLKEKRFFHFWIDFLVWYARTGITCSLEMLTIVIGIIAFMKIGW